MSGINNPFNSGPPGSGPIDFGPSEPANNFETFEMDLGPDAPGFSLRERVDLSGHNSGRVDPHVNVDLVNPSGRPLDFFKQKTGDLCNNQLPGFNGMQQSLFDIDRK